MREINENFRKNYPELTALELDKPYKAGEEYPHKSPIGTLEITVKQYIRFKDLPKRIQDIIEDGFNAADYHDDYYDMTDDEFAQIPFATALGSDGDPYILIRMEDNNEWEAINTEETKYLTVQG